MQSAPWFLKPGWSYIAIFCFAFVLYANTIGHQFTQDDAIVIYDNSYTKQGLAGVSDIFTKDSFSGFFGEEGKSSLVSGGRYRPLTLAFFAVVWELFGNSTIAYHLFAILIYGLLGCMLLLVGRSFDFHKEGKQKTILTFILAAVFISHPIHTEAVANVKGLDEVFSILWSLLAMFLGLRFVKTGTISNLIGMGGIYFLAMMSKENAAAFVVLIPLTIWGFSKLPSVKRLITSFGVLFVVFIIYAFIRGQVIGWELGDPPQEMMNNPFMKLEGNRYIPFSFSEQVSSIIYGLGKYIQLLFFPHPLTHDYYPRVFGVVSFSDPSVIMSIIMNVTMSLIAVLGLKKKSIITFCIIWFYATIFLMSNIVFPIGTHLSERFLFTPSIAYALLITYAYHRSELTIFGKYRNAILLVLIIAFSGKTISRNQIWESDFKLFTTDVHVSKNSAKVRNAAGGALVNAAIKETDIPKQKKMLVEALEHLNKATEIHPNYKNAFLLKGNAYSYLKQYDQSIAAYDMTLRLDPYYDEAEGNLLIVLREGARYAGETLKDFDKSISYLQRALTIAPQDYSTNSLMGVAQGSTGNHRAAIKYFDKAITINPDIARAYVNLGYALLNIGDEDNAQINFQQAVQLDPDIMDKN